MEETGREKGIMASNEEEKHDDVVAIELPAPSGWVKKFTPRKVGTPRKSDIFFISPTGEKIKNKRELEQYLKSHPGEHVGSDFDWGTGNPRRSARLSGLSKADDGAESESPKKRQKKSDTKEPKEKDDAVGADEATDDKDAAAGEIKESMEVATEDEENVGDKKFTEEAPTQTLSVEDVDKETNIEEVLEGPSAVEIPFTDNTKTKIEASASEIETDLASAKVDKSEEKSCGEHESPVKKAEDSETGAKDQDYSVEKQAAE